MAEISPVIYGADNKPIAPAVRTRAQVQARQNQLRTRYSMGRAYEASGHDHPITRDWHASPLSGQAAQSFSRVELSNRVHDIERNDGHVASGIEKKVNSVVGDGWRLASKPDAKRLGISHDEADNIAEQIEAYWREYSKGAGFWCDAAREGTANDLLMVADRHVELDAEAFGIIVMRDDDAPCRFKTAMQLIHPMRCSNPNGVMDSETLKDGTVLDKMGATVGYYFRRSHPGDAIVGAGQWQWDYFPRETEWGRPRVVHVKGLKEAGMKRSISRLVATLRKQKQGEKYFDYELQASAINAIHALFIETPLDMFEAMDAIGPDKQDSIAEENADYHKELPIKVEGVQANVLAPGEKAILSSPNHPNEAFEPFLKHVLRGLASILGITYEQLTMDWSDVNYSSARAAILEVSKGFRVTAGWLKNQFMSQWYCAWLEELFDLQLLTLPDNAPDFYAAKEAWSQCNWIGSSKGYLDAQKEVEAAGMRMALGLSTLEEECADQGKDYREIIRQRGKERRELIAEGLDPDAGRIEARTQSFASEVVEEEISPDEQDNGNTDKAYRPRVKFRYQRRGNSVPVIKKV